MRVGLFFLRGVTRRGTCSGVADSPRRRCPRWWLAFFAACLPPFSLFSCPLSPRPPSPAGKGEIFVILLQGASPLASPGLNPGGTGAGGESRAGGGVPSESPTRRKTDRTAFLLAVPAAKERGDRGRWNYPSQATAAFEMVLSPGADRASAAGACLLCRLPTYPAFSLFFCPPIPPSPFPGGEGGDQGYFMQGASPLASPGRNPRGTGSTCRCRRLNGGVPPALLARRALAVPGGGLPSLSPAAPVFSLLFCPLSPLSPRPPSPAGKGETKVISCKGLRPLHPRG